MSCRDLANRSPLGRRWHRIWCTKCRAARRADAILDRGIVGLKSALPPSEGLARTLAAVGALPTPSTYCPKSSRGAAVRRWLVPTAVVSAFVAVGLMGQLYYRVHALGTPVLTAKIPHQNAYPPPRQASAPDSHRGRNSQFAFGQPIRSPRSIRFTDRQRKILTTAMRLPGKAERMRKSGRMPRTLRQRFRQMDIARAAVSHPRLSTRPYPEVVHRFTTAGARWSEAAGNPTRTSMSDNEPSFDTTVEVSRSFGDIDRSVLTQRTESGVSIPLRLSIQDVPLIPDSPNHGVGSARDEFRQPLAPHFYRVVFMNVDDAMANASPWWRSYGHKSLVECWFHRSKGRLTL